MGWWVWWGKNWRHPGCCIVTSNSKWCAAQEATCYTAVPQMDEGPVRFQLVQGSEGCADKSYVIELYALFYKHTCKGTDKQYIVVIGPLLHLLTWTAVGIGTISGQMSYAVSQFSVTQRVLALQKIPHSAVFCLWGEPQGQEAGVRGT